MERTTNRLLNEYRHGDHTKRLHLYLQYPDLRLDFMQMEQNVPPQGQATCKPARSRMKRICFLRPFYLGCNGFRMFNDHKP